MHQIRPTNPMRDQVLSVPDLIREQIWELEARTRKILTTPEVFSLRQIILTGSGDSHIAAMAAEMAFNELAGISTLALCAMDVSRYRARYYDHEYPNHPLVIAISNSGEAARVVEATRRFNQAGGLTLALTANAESRLGSEAQRAVLLPNPSFLPSPGVRSYVLTLLALYLLAIRFGELRGRMTMDEAQALRQELEASASAIEQTVEQFDKALRKLVKDWAALDNFEFLGSGPGKGSAAYGAAKLLEAAGSHALYQDIEEWAHLQFFVARAQQTGTVLIAPSDSYALSRAIEISRLLETLQRPYRVLTDSQTNLFKNALQLPVRVREIFSPLVYMVPLALLAGYVADAQGQEYGRGNQAQWADSRNATSVKNSVIEA
jgi:glucosamine--fructose-6-phosphate aminotransferase (isomerizing)